MARVAGSALTGVGDVEASASGGMIWLELQADDVPSAGELGGHLIARKGAQHRYIWNPVILDRKEVKLRFHIEVIKD